MYVEMSFHVTVPFNQTNMTASMFIRRGHIWASLENQNVMGWMPLYYQL